jgi:hypothetical protein
MNLGANPTAQQLRELIAGWGEPPGPSPSDT